jgi:hypothetical protein
MQMNYSGDVNFFGLLELPFLCIAVVFGFRVAAKLRGGSFGAGMSFLAWGFLVMAAGHLIMQIERYGHIDILQSLFGATLGDILWIVALVTTWTLSAYGFLRIYRAASGG